MRLSEEELAEVDRRREACGYRWLGEYCRVALLAQQAPKAVVPAVNAEQYRKPHHLGNNLNPLARHLNLGNIGADPETAELRALLEQTRDELGRLRRALSGRED